MTEPTQLPFRDFEKRPWQKEGKAEDNSVPSPFAKGRDHLAIPDVKTIYSIDVLLTFFLFG
jgi:hypothetical protein